MSIIATMAGSALIAMLPQGALDITPGAAAFEHEGRRYVYTVVEKGRSRVIEGHDEQSLRPFRLVVGKTFVTGTVAGTPVSFPRSAVKPVSGGVTVDMAAR